jgi:hypothetical protein
MPTPNAKPQFQHEVAVFFFIQWWEGENRDGREEQTEKKTHDTERSHWLLPLP